MADPSTWPQARDLRDRVKFQRRTVTQSALGGTTGTWYDLVGSRSAKLIPFRPRRKGGDEVQGARLQGTAPYDLWVRWDSQTRQVTSDDRVVDLRNPSRVFKIGFVEDMDRRSLWLVMQLELGVADG